MRKRTASIWLSRPQWKELLQACEDFPEVANTWLEKRLCYWVACNASSAVFTEAARSLEMSLRKGKNQAMYGRFEPLDAFKSTVQNRLDLRAIAQFVVRTYIFEIMPQRQLRPVDLSIWRKKLTLTQIKCSANDLEGVTSIHRSTLPWVMQWH